MTSSALTLRSDFGLSAMNIEPVLMVRPPPPPPMKEMACSTAGSCSTTCSSANCRSFIAGNEMSCGASVKPDKSPVSCCGNSPFGTIT